MRCYRSSEVGRGCARTPRTLCVNLSCRGSPVRGETSASLFVGGEKNGWDDRDGPRGYLGRGARAGDLARVRVRPDNPNVRRDRPPKDGQRFRGTASEGSEERVVATARPRARSDVRTRTVLLGSELSKTS